MNSHWILAVSSTIRLLVNRVIWLPLWAVLVMFSDDYSWTNDLISVFIINHNYVHMIEMDLFWATEIEKSVLS